MRRIWILLGWFMLMGMAAGCSLPGIVIIEDPLKADEHFQLGLAYEEKKEFDLAIREYGEASRSIPLAHHHLGNVYFQKQDYAAAEKSYRRAIKRLPKDPNPPNNLAWMFLTLGKNLGEAQELALAAVNLAPAENKATYQDTLDQIKKAIASRPQEAAPAPKPPDPTNTIP